MQVIDFAPFEQADKIKANSSDVARKKGIEQPIGELIFGYLRRVGFGPYFSGNGLRTEAALLKKVGLFQQIGRNIERNGRFQKGQAARVVFPFDGNRGTKTVAVSRFFNPKKQDAVLKIALDDINPVADWTSPRAVMFP